MKEKQCSVIIKVVMVGIFYIKIDKMREIEILII